MAGGALAIALLVFLFLVVSGQADNIQVWFQLDPAAPGRPGASMGDLVVNNLRLAVVGFGSAFLLKFGDGRYRRWLKPVLDALLIIVGVGNAFLVGAALGAYGSVLGSSIVVYALLEVCGVAVAGSAYLDARNNTPTWQRLAAYAPFCVVCLLAAALVEP